MIGLLGKGDRSGRREIDHEPLCAQFNHHGLECIELPSAAAHNNLLPTIMNRHLHAFMTNQGVKAIVDDYDEDAVLYTPDCVYRGVAEIRRFFEAFLGNLPEYALDIFRMRTQEAHGEVGYIVWSVGELIPLGTDTFVIKDGKIVRQTYAAHIGNW